MTSKHTTARKAVTPPQSTKVVAQAPIVEKKFIPQFSNREQDYKATVYSLVPKSKKRNGMPQYPVVCLLKAEDIIYLTQQLDRTERLDTFLEKLLYT